MLVPEGTEHALRRCVARMINEYASKWIRFLLKGHDLQGLYWEVCAVDGSVEEVHDSDGNGILRCAWIGTPRTVVSTKMQPLFEMASFISIIINEQTNGVSVLCQIAEGLDDEMEGKR